MLAKTDIETRESLKQSCRRKKRKVRIFADERGSDRHYWRNLRVILKIGEKFQVPFEGRPPCPVVQNSPQYAPAFSSLTRAMMGRSLPTTCASDWKRKEFRSGKIASAWKVDVTGGYRSRKRLIKLSSWR